MEKNTEMKKTFTNGLNIDLSQQALVKKDSLCS